MSRDIRSFFTVISKKAAQPASQPPKAKKPAKPVIQSDDEDIIPETPPQNVKDSVPKKRKVQVLSSDSEDETQKPKIKEKKKKTDTSKANLKPLSSLEEVFGKAPVKQTKVESKKEAKKLETEVGIHDDPAFEKTLQELDDDFLEQNADALDKTIEEVMNSSKLNSSKIKTPRKRKHSESGDNDEERYEKKRHSAVLYQKYLNRSGPKHHGSKEVPKGKPDCLKNLCFMRTGVLDSLDNDDFETAVKEHGGRVVHAVSKKVNYLVVGEEPGPAKLAKANNYGIPTISEDEFLDLIRTKSGMPPLLNKEEKSEVQSEQTLKELEEIPEKENNVKKESPAKKPEKNGKQSNKTVEKNSQIRKQSPTKRINGAKATKTNISPPSTSKANLNNLKLKKDTARPQEHPKIVHSKDLPLIEHAIRETPDANLCWTEKHKPKDLKSVIGQQGDKSNMRKLLNWLKNWHRYHSGKDRPKVTRPSPWAKDDDGAYFKCTLLSGPPGVGKTTTATLVAQELGFDIVEFNASDTRSKRLLREEVSQLLRTTSLAGFATAGSKATKVTDKRVLLMDEVDGMAGNEDRGGVQELIALIKDTRVPIICMCNDRNHPKIRSLVNHCFDLRFAKPRLEQIKGAMMSVCFKEGIKISPDALTQIINGTGMDIRQTLNHLSMWTASQQVLTAEEAEKKAGAAKKDTVLGPWEVVRMVFSAEEHKTMTLADKARLFFFDYSIGPLFVQENYLKVVPHAPKKEFLIRASQTADSISMSDKIDAKIRGSNNWALLETQAMFASVLPGHYMEGHMGGQINFPSWLGKNSRRNKLHRLLNEVQSHARTNISGGRLAMCLDYLPCLRNKIIDPMIKEGTAGVERSLDVMKSYHLLREDLDSIIELTHWPNQKDVMSLIDSKVKAAFTRTYNKMGPVLPFAPQANVSKKKGVSHDDLYGEEEDGVESNPEEDEDVEKDALIKPKKKTAAKAKKDENSKAPKKTSSLKGKGKKEK